MRRKRKHERLLLLLMLSMCLAVAVFFVFSVEVSYFLGVHIRPLSYPVYEFLRDYKQHNCELTEVAVVLGGYETVVRGVTLIKSILIVHPGPLSFHIITDNASHSVLETLFQTWQLPEVAYHVYRMESFVNRVSWVPNSHYSHNYGLIKLLLPDILHRNVEKVVLLLDSDVLVVGEIGSLIAQFHRMNATNTYAMAENMSGWYTTHSPTRRIWPALGRGFNSGVALVNLKRMREIEWDRIWREIATKQLRKTGTTSLADQDILNAVFKANPEQIMKLPCEYNLQLGLLSEPENCALQARDVKIVHWNSPQKTRTRTRYSAFFRRKFDEVADLDGNVFRHRMTCSQPITEEKPNTFSRVPNYDEYPQGCDVFASAAYITHRTHLFVKDFHYIPIKGDVTLVTQLTIERFSAFEKILKAWPGPISASFYVTDAELEQLREYMTEVSARRSQQNLALHAVFKEGKLYPINYLRNVAINASVTDHLFLSDVDFIPSENLYEKLQSVVRRSDMTKKALVVPAFEVKSAEYGVNLETKEELIKLINENQVTMFRSDLWPRGHSATNYDRWKEATEPYQVAWQMDYEPYIVVKRHALPLYDTRFAGFGWNKVTHIMTINVIGYTFEVLPDVFIVHEAHSPSFEIIKYRNSPLYRKCMRALRGHFVRNLITSAKNKSSMS